MLDDSGREKGPPALYRKYCKPERRIGPFQNGTRIQFASISAFLHVSDSLGICQQRMSISRRSPVQADLPWEGYEYADRGSLAVAGRLSGAFMLNVHSMTNIVLYDEKAHAMRDLQGL